MEQYDQTSMNRTAIKAITYILSSVMKFTTPAKSEQNVSPLQTFTSWPYFECHNTWQNDTQHSATQLNKKKCDNQHNDTQHINKKCNTRHNIMMSSVLLNVVKLSIIAPQIYQLFYEPSHRVSTGKHSSLFRCQ